MSRWLFYALGGGLGHLTRATALARRAVRDGITVEILTNSPFAAAVDEPGVDLRRLPADVDPDTVRHHVEATSFDLLVVDTFPRGLGGELAPILDDIGPKVLVHRTLDARYIAAVDVRSAVDRYDHIFVPGEMAPFADHPRAVRTAPWLVRDASELFASDVAKAQLGIADDRAVVGVLASGHVDEGGWFARTAATLRSSVDADVLLLSPVNRDDLPEAKALWPLLELHRGIDVLVGAGGYNTVQEARATGTPLVATAMRRKYDDQAARLRDDERASSIDDVVTRVRQHLATGRRGDSGYENGAEVAARILTGRTSAASPAC